MCLKKKEISGKKESKGFEKMRNQDGLLDSQLAGE